MTSRGKNRLAGLGFAMALAAGCTATGAIDFAKIAGTIMHAAALNYTGPFVTGVDALVTAFTGEPIERPQVQQFPPSQYPDQGYASQQYPDQQYPQQQYPDQQYPQQQYPDQQYPQQQYPAQQYPDQQYPSQQYPDQQYPQQGSADYQYPDSQYAGYQYPETQDPSYQYPEPQYPTGGTANYPDQGWQSWGSQYPQPSTRSVPAEDALSIDLALFTIIDGKPVVMPDGARLRDGIGRPEPGDRFGIAFATSETAYVYIVNIDATGWAQTLFPYPAIPGFDNPVRPGQQILLPNNELYGLDEQRGIETIFVLVSRTPNPDVEAAIAPFRGVERNTAVAARGITERVRIPLIGQRGLVGITPAANQAGPVSLDRFFTERSTAELAFSRWFIHE